MSCTTALGTSQIIAVRLYVQVRTLLSLYFLVFAVQREQIWGRAARFIYDRIVDRDLIIIADDVESLPAEPPACEKRPVLNTEDAVHKMSQLLGRGEACPALSRTNFSGAQVLQWACDPSEMTAFLTSSFVCLLPVRAAHR